MTKGFPPPLVVYKLAVSPRENFEIRYVILNFPFAIRIQPGQNEPSTKLKVSRSQF